MIPLQLQGEVQTVLGKHESAIFSIKFALFETIHWQLHSDLIVRSRWITALRSLGTTRQRSTAVISMRFVCIQQILKSFRALRNFNRKLQRALTTTCKMDMERKTQLNSLGWEKANWMRIRGLGESKRRRKRTRKKEWWCRKVGRVDEEERYERGAGMKTVDSKWLNNRCKVST